MIQNKFFGISGVEFSYFFVCQTQLWLFSHGLIKSDEDENVKIGRLIHANRYQREKREKELYRSKFDVIKLGQEYVIYELKKSSVFDSHLYQLKFYMYQIEKLTGCRVKGIIRSEKIKKVVELNQQDIKIIEDALEQIKIIKNMADPPVPIKKNICKKCAYRTFCFGDQYG